MDTAMVASPSRSVCGTIFALLSLAMGGLCTAHAEEFTPLPDDIFKGRETGNPVLDMRDRAVDSLSNSAPQMPENLEIESEGGSIVYENDKRRFTYDGGNVLRLKTDKDGYMQAQRIEIDLQNELASLQGPMTAYQSDMLVRSEKGGTYAWRNGEATLGSIRTKINGLIIRGSSIEYRKDSAGKQYVVIHDAYVTTEDVGEPSSWIGTGTMIIYPGEYASVSRLSIAGKNWDVPVPVLGWFTFSHSLNPKEGYLPNLGSQSTWGTYLLNRYGFLLGNRRVEKGRPTADYLVTTHLDYRTRRGVATGLDAEEPELVRRYDELSGFHAYFLADSDPMINPTDIERETTRHNRYRIALQHELNVTPDADTKGKWLLNANVNVLSDQYVLRDFYEVLSRLDNQPDNTIRLTRVDKRTQSMLYSRFTPNDFYTTDRRAEASFYRVRSAIGNTGFNYETNNSASFMSQYLPLSERRAYDELLNTMAEGEQKEYIRQLRNTQAYARINSSHELSTSMKLLNFVNITPKIGGGYTGYYDVGGVGNDNRFLGYMGCDIDFKFFRRYPGFSYKNFGLKELTHILHPFVSYSQASVSSSNALVPRVDFWSNVTGTSTTSPMPLDFIGYNGIDGWGKWTVVRLGVQNIFNSRIDGDKIRLIDWNVFIDANVDNPGSDADFSDLYNSITFTPSRRLSVSLNSQTPTIKNGYGYYQYDLNATYMPFSWLEGTVGYRSLKDHPSLLDAEQVYIRGNLRIDERTAVSSQWSFDIEEQRVPIQEYSVFRNYGAWYVGATFFIRDNGGKKEEGFGLSFTLGETGTSLPVKLY